MKILCIVGSGCKVAAGTFKVGAIVGKGGQFRGNMERRKSSLWKLIVD